ncbi:glutathione S-transferase family protein [Sphingomonas sp. ID1715]|uniref:glutathione S-transferase family protein n=1 Tax=Sphingomonas sp. ID1715 TaxID=1656898 RepID=UPI00148995A7|nr:glutathione S-transferase family protein [Sphingomonas sp. ID1715]NNM78680.1 glutathione S-transferase family protein [Sphingomonas sp. ID1715]
MPVDPNAAVTVSAYDWVPDFAKGHVRDLRVRWALEEVGVPYATRLLDVQAERPADYMAVQPFGQVPSYRDGHAELFESGAIVLHIADRWPGLLPQEASRRARAKSWVVAALNSIEPITQQLAEMDFFHAGEAWTKERRPQVAEQANKRLQQLSDYLGGRDWLESEFTAGDLMMIAVLRIFDGQPTLDPYPNLSAYVGRGQSRPAFARALAAQLADFRKES